VDDRDGFEDSMLEVKAKATGLQGQVQGQWCFRPRTKPDLFGVKAKAKTFSPQAVLEDALGPHSDAILICFELPPLLPPR